MWDVTKAVNWQLLRRKYVIMLIDEEWNPTVLQHIRVLNSYIPTVSVESVVGVFSMKYK